RRGLGWGEVLLASAPLSELAPQINLSGRRHGTLDLRRAAAAAAATEFRAVTAGAPGRREAVVFDGEGRSIRAGDLDPAQPEEISPRPARPAAIRPAGRDGLAPERPIRGGVDDAAALLGGDRAATLAAMEAEA